MEKENHVALRVLYTINTSPQYILAKSLEKIPLVSADASLEANGMPVYGRAPLKTCALAICQSSPEISPDASKDYSVYVLDPLEDFMSKERRGQSSTSSGGVAVGMGLLSKVLYGDNTSEPLKIIGTIVACGNGEYALEVVLSLKQMTPAPQSIPHPLPRSESHTPFSYNQGPNAAGPSTSATDTDEDSTRPLFASHPLPTFQERPYHPSNLYQPYPYNTQFAHPPRKKKARKKNPCHDTQAYQLPTPYIGPPRRKPGRPKKPSDDDDDDDSDDDDSAQQYAGQSGSHLGQSQASDFLPTPSSSQTSQQLSPAPPFDIAQSAVILAALSAVNSSNASAPVPPIAPDAPNEALVAFLKAYLSSLESPNSASSNISPVPERATPTPQATPVESTNGNANDCGQIDNPVDKENVKPSHRSQVQEKETRQPASSVSTSPASAAPLGLGRYNSRSDLSSDVSMPKASTSEGPQPSNGRSRKRRLSETIRMNEAASRSKRKSSFETLAPPPDEAQFSYGWGGLRNRTDGGPSTSETQPPPPPPPPPPVRPRSSIFAEPQVPQQVTYFKTTYTTTTSVRKGPFVVPTWARNVPPPLPPKRPEENNPEAEGNQDSNKSKKRTKTKGLGRLGDQKKSRKVSATSSGLEPSPDLRAPHPPVEKENSKPTTPKTSPLRSPALRMPVFAQSSPVVKTSYTSLFQAFQTSPCRPPRASNISPRRHEPPTTPRRVNTKSPKSCSATGPRFSSLFTPSPITTSLGPRSGHQSLFDMIPDPPPSPTPSKRYTRPNAEAGSSKKGSNAQPSPAGQSFEQRCKEFENDDEPSSSLPVASSEPDYESSIQPSSSDLTVTTSFKVHDWTSLELPPSSPPLPSSPALPILDENDLPGSDLPSSDFDFGETPSSTSEADESNAALTPQELEEHPSLAILDDTTFANMDQFLSDWDFSEFDMNVERHEGTAADEALDALRNGIGQEDFSEAWNLLNSVLQVPNGDSVADTTEGGSDLLSFGQDTSSENGVDIGFANTDYANLVASNFEDLLKGCLV